MVVEPEPRIETILRHANVDSCVTGCGSDSGLVYDVVGKARAIDREGKGFSFCNCIARLTRSLHQPFLGFSHCGS